MACNLQILRFVYLALTLICIASFITEPSSLLNQNSRNLCIGIPVSILVFLFFSGKNISTLIKYISVIYLLFVMPRILMLLYAPAYINSPFEFSDINQINRGLFIFLSSTFMLLLGLFIGHKLFTPSETKKPDKNASLLSVAIIFIITFIVQCYLSFYIGISPYANSPINSNKLLNNFLSLFFSLDILTWLILVLVLGSQSRVHSKAWLVLLYSSLILYMCFSASIGSRGASIKIFLEATAILLVASKSIIYKKKPIIFFFFFVVFSGICIFPIANFARVKLIIPSSEISEIIKPSDSQNVVINENKISYLNTSILIANRLSAPFDSAILLPYANKNDGAFKKYINYEYFFKSTLNSLVPGVLYPDATISTSRLINVIFRNVSIEHIKKYGYFSEFWTSFALLFLMFGFISIFIHFLIGFFLEFFYKIISDVRIVNSSWLLSIYVGLIPGVILFSMGIDHTIATIFILSIQLCLAFVSYKLLIFLLNLIKNRN